jgi:hypothetical protein
VKDDLKKLGYTVIWTEVVKTNQPAIAWHQKQGFEFNFADFCRQVQKELCIAWLRINKPEEVSTTNQE